MVKVIFPSVLRSATNGVKETELTASTLGEVIAKLEDEFGDAFSQRFLDANGNPTRLLNIFVNGKNARFLDYLDTELRDNDEITILPAIGGG
jgi:MoaD family protein